MHCDPSQRNCQDRKCNSKHSKHQSLLSSQKRKKAVKKSMKTLSPVYMPSVLVQMFTLETSRILPLDYTKSTFFFFFLKVKKKWINVINLEDITPSILFCVTVNLIALKHFISKINVSFARHDIRPWETRWPIRCISGHSKPCSPHGRFRLFIFLFTQKARLV